MAGRAQDSGLFDLIILEIQYLVITFTEWLVNFPFVDFFKYLLKFMFFVLFLMGLFGSFLELAELNHSMSRRSMGSNFTIVYSYPPSWNRSDF